MIWKMKTRLIKNMFSHMIAYALPKKVLYYCVIRIWAELSTDVYPKKTPDKITWLMAIDYLDSESNKIKVKKK